MAKAQPSTELQANAQQEVASVTPAQGETAAILGLIERAARDPAVDIDKLERLFAMKERIEAKALEAAFNTAMAAAQAELKPVIRNLKNAQTGSEYADLAAISEQIDPIIHKHGLGTIASEFTSALPNHLGIRLEVIHSAGFSRSYDFNIPIDAAGLAGKVNKTPTHAYASTITYGRRYAKSAVFDVATKNDKDGNTPDPANGVVTPEQAEELAKLISETSSDIDWVLNKFKIDSLSDMTVKDFNFSKAQLIAKKQHQAKERAAAAKQEKPNG